MDRILYTLAAAALAGLLGGCGSSSSANPPPVLEAASFSGDEDTEIAGQLAASDPDDEPLTFERTGEPASGTIVSFEPSGAFVYRPAADFAGTDSFPVKVTDPAGGEATGRVSLEVRPVNDRPVAVNDVQRVDGAALANVALLENDREPDGDALTVTIEEPAHVGTARVNPDGTIRIDGLPPGFRGLTRFRYRVTDPAGESSTATAAIFVAADPFRVVFAAEDAAAGGPEIFMTDFVSAPWRISAASSGNLRLRGFAAADNGATVVYRRASTAGSATDLSFVRTTAPDQQVRVALPDGAVPVTDPAGNEQFVVSPNGQWIAAVARPSAGGREALYVLDVNEPATVRDVAPPSARRVTLPRFSADSAQLYFLATDRDDGTQRMLYRVAPGVGAPAVRLSAAYGAGSAAQDDILQYEVSPDQLRVALHALRGGNAGLFHVAPASPGIETAIHHALSPLEQIISSTVGLPPGRGATATGERVGYTTFNFATFTPSVYVAQVASQTANGRQVSDFGRALAWRPDGSALLIARFAGGTAAGEDVHELLLDAGAAPERIGTGNFALYDGTAEAVVLRSPQPPDHPAALAAAVRGAFGDAQSLGTNGSAVHASDLTGIDRGVVLLGEGPAGDAPDSVRLALASAWAPRELLFLGSRPTPLDLSAPLSQVVTY